MSTAKKPPNHSVWKLRKLICRVSNQVRSLGHITSGMSTKDRIPPANDKVGKLDPATIMPDNAPPAAPDNAISTSTVPWVFARVEASVESTISAVPLIKPRFQPNPSKERAAVRRTIESPGANAASKPARSSVIPEAIAMAVRPSLSTRIPVTREGRYMAPI